MAQLSVWKVTVEMNRTWDGVMIPPHSRHREVRHVEANPYAPRELVVSMVNVDQARFRVLDVTRWKEVRV